MGPLDDLQAAAAARAQELRSLCRDLVAAPSVSPPGDTTAPAAVLCDYLTSRGIDPSLVAADPTKPNVVARIDGQGPGLHLVLNVHLDTMPTGPIDQWTVDPQILTERDGRWFGLGMGNMKGAAAAMAVAFVLLAERRDEWCGTITFTAVSDEVVFGDAGAAHLIRTRPDIAEPDGLLCGEGPGFMRLGLAEKGLLWCRIVAVAAPGHASGARRGATATTRLAEALVRLDAHNDTTVELPAALGGVPDDQSEARRLSINVGTITGGSFIGQQATEASAEIDIRVPPGLLLADVHSILADTLDGLEGVTIETIRGWEANWSGLDDPLVAAVAEAAAIVRGTPPVPSVRLPASDASRWRGRGVGAICYGPQPTLSSGVDDYAEAQSVHDCTVVYAAAARQFLAPSSDAIGETTTTDPTGSAP